MDLEKPHFNTSIWKVPRKQEPYIMLLCVYHQAENKTGKQDWLWEGTVIQRLAKQC